MGIDKKFFKCSSLIHNLKVCKNGFFMLVGVGMFFLSFHVGESSLIGGILHLSGCAVFCSNLHSIHDVKMEEEVHPHGHH
jgi:hypothetical protein